MPAKKRPSDTATEAGPSNATATDATSVTSSSKKRRTSNNNTSTSRRHFHYLRARTRHISQHTITTRWTTLPPPAQGPAKQLFRDIKRATVLQHARGDEKRRVEAEMALSAVVRKLEGAVGQMVFPALPAAGTKAEGLVDLGRWITRNRTLEAELNPAMHAKEVLLQEIEREEEALRREKALLKRLEDNARSEERAWKKREGKTHPLLAAAEIAKGDDAESINLLPTEKMRLTREQEEDQDLVGILGQLENHLDSLRGNTEAVEGVDDAIADARNALGDMLRGRLGEQAADALDGS
jgi:kinetochore protein Fta7